MRQDSDRGWRCGGGADAACGVKADGPPDIVVDRTACATAGCSISEPVYAAAYRTPRSEARVFDDIGCLLEAAAREPRARRAPLLVPRRRDRRLDRRHRRRVRLVARAPHPDGRRPGRLPRSRRRPRGCRAPAAAASCRRSTTLLRRGKADTVTSRIARFAAARPSRRRRSSPCSSILPLWTHDDEGAAVSEGTAARGVRQRDDRGRARVEHHQPLRRDAADRPGAGARDGDAFRSRSRVAHRPVPAVAAAPVGAPAGAHRGGCAMPLGDPRRRAVVALPLRPHPRSQGADSSRSRSRRS